MKMTDHYRLLANAIKVQVDKFDDDLLDVGDDVLLEKELEYRRGVAETANTICGMLEGTDRTFDRDWFAAACGLYVSKGRDVFRDCLPNQLTWEKPQ